MTGIACFPLSIQSQNSSDYGTYGSSSVEFELVGDLFAGVSSVAGKLANAFHSSVKAKAAAKAKTLDSQSVDKASKLLSEQEKLVLARDPKAAPAILVSLSQDASSAVRNEVALNPSSPAFILRKLALDSDKFIASQARTRLS